MKNNLGQLIFFRVICAFIKSTKLAFPNKIQSKPRILTRFLGAISCPLKKLRDILSLMLIFGSILKLVHIEIISL